MLWVVQLPRCEIHEATPGTHPPFHVSRRIWWEPVPPPLLPCCNPSVFFSKQCGLLGRALYHLCLALDAAKPPSVMNAACYLCPASLSLVVKWGSQPAHSDLLEWSAKRLTESRSEPVKMALSVPQLCFPHPGILKSSSTALSQASKPLSEARSFHPLSCHRFCLWSLKFCFL